MNLEQDLERALQRTGPPAGFASRVLGQIAAGERSSAPPPRRLTQRGWRAIAAGILLTALAGGWAAQRAIDRREGERAAGEVMVALKIASSKVRTAQQQVRDLGSR